MGNPIKTVAHEIESAIPSLLAAVGDAALVGIERWADGVNRKLQEFDPSPIISGPWDDGLPNRDPEYWVNRQKTFGAKVAGKTLEGVKAVIPNSRETWHDVTQSGSWKRGTAILGPLGTVQSAAGNIRSNDGMVGLSLIQTGVEEGASVAGSLAGIGILGGVDGVPLPVTDALGALARGLAGAQAGQAAASSIGSGWKDLGWQW